MPPLPWTNGRAAGAAPGTELVYLASRLDLRRLGDVAGFLVAALRLRRVFRSAQGGVGLALQAQPLRRTFWTLSAWTDPTAIEEFTRNPVHLEVLRRFRPRMAGSAFTTWTGHDPIPAWDEARRRLAAIGPARRARADR